MGSFGGLFEFKGYEEPLLVSSVDQVGTKTKISAALGKHDTVGIDIVNHCVNDILTCGAEPLFFLDYIGMGKLVPERVEAIARGLAKPVVMSAVPLSAERPPRCPGYTPARTMT